MIKVNEHLSNLTNHIYEQILEYALWKADQVNSLDELKKCLKDDLKNLHHKNMVNIDKSLNQD